jgi:hyperosmotically inducible periplasmic protein
MRNTQRLDGNCLDSTRPSRASNRMRYLKTTAIVSALLVSAGGAPAADEISNFKSYVDSDICSHLMLGPINSARVECSQKTHKDGSGPVLVRLTDNTVLEVNKQKMINKLVGQLADVSGELNLRDGTIKLKDVKPIDSNSIPKGDPARRLLDVRTFKTTGDKTFEKIRHELAMMPYISEFDYISFTMVGNDVLLSGWTIRNTNRSYAENVIKNIEGVEKIINNIEVLPLGSIDMQIRGAARAALQQNLSRYFWGSGSDIKIIVKNGDIILLGSVTNEGDKNIAGIRCNSIRNAFHVFNLLRVQGSAPEKKG